MLSNLKGFVNNTKNWNAFTEYLDSLIVQQQATLEQSQSIDVIHRTQGALFTLRKLQKLRDETNKNG